MRTISLILILGILAAVPLRADRGQSYVSYDDGGSVIRQGEDGKEIDARINMPIFPGDDYVTSRTGRSELRLSDGNVVALDRSTSIHFRSILDSYDGDASETVAELRFGQIVMHRRDDRSAPVRIDTDSASYVAASDTIYSLESDGKGRDRVSVFQGSLEVRTPDQTSTLNSGDEAHVDDTGLYGLVDLPRNAAGDLERWFLRRADRYDRGSSRYLDSNIAYSDYDLDANGSWTYVGSLGTWAWRPRVAADWRPYYNGSWQRSPGGELVWVSTESWGWVPYHYGRWGFDSTYGWVWVPGGGYAPAWVYWMYGSSYVGWAPAGYWDVYKPYFDWCYRPSQRAGLDVNVGFYGRIRVHDLDFRPWIFANPSLLISTRIDRALLSHDIIRERLLRDGNNATVSNAAARFSHSDLKDPSVVIGSIARRGIGSGTGKEGPGSPAADMTSFFRRDPELSSTLRDRVARARGGDPSGSGRSSASAPAVAGTPAHETGSWRDRISRPAGATPGRDPGARAEAGTPAVADRPVSGNDGGSTSWRDRGARTRDGAHTPDRGTERSAGAPPADANPDRSSDVPRRIIDRIGGARVVPSSGDGNASSGRQRPSGSGSSRDGASRDRGSAPPARVTPPSTPPPARESKPQEPKPAREDKHHVEHHKD